MNNLYYQIILRNTDRKQLLLFTQAFTFRRFVSCARLAMNISDRDRNTLFMLRVAERELCCLPYSFFTIQFSDGFS